LNALFPDLSDSYGGPEFRFVMSMVLGAFEPLSQQSLAALVQVSPQAIVHDEEGIQAVLRGMGSVLTNITPQSLHDPIVPLHTSFRDFLTAEKRAGEKFFIDLDKTHLQLARACFGVMLDDVTGLCFNVCGLDTSHALNADVSDLKARIERHIPPSLLYACLYWDDHLAKVSFTKDICDRVAKLFKEKLLFWLEILSLARSMRHAIHAVVATKIWLTALVSSLPRSLCAYSLTRLFLN
jgi:hypothetical protein